MTCVHVKHPHHRNIAALAFEGMAPRHSAFPKQIKLMNAPSILYSWISHSHNHYLLNPAPNRLYQNRSRAHRRTSSQIVCSRIRVQNRGLWSMRVGDAVVGLSSRCIESTPGDWVAEM